MKWHCHSLSWKAWNKYRHLLHIFKTLIFLCGYQSWKRLCLETVVPFGKNTSTFSSGSSPRVTWFCSLTGKSHFCPCFSLFMTWITCPYTRFYWAQHESGKKKCWWISVQVQLGSWCGEVQIMTQKTCVSLSTSMPEQTDPTKGKNTPYYFIFFPLLPDSTAFSSFHSSHKTDSYLMT